MSVCVYCALLCVCMYVRAAADDLPEPGGYLRPSVSARRLDPADEKIPSLLFAKKEGNRERADWAAT